jgi:hypothetical protein
MPTITLLRFEWKLADMWIGIFWKHTTCSVDNTEKVLSTDIWVCLLPCVPLHVALMWPVTIDITKD